MRKTLRSLLIIFLFKLKRIKFKNAIIICSEPRGGSTWLAESLQKLIPKSLINWEPLHKDQGVVPEGINFGFHPKIFENDTNLEYKKLFEDIFRLKRINSHTLKKVSIKKHFFSKYVITKFVNANYLLPWFVSQFNLNYKPILLLRHPIHTCVSHYLTFKRITEEEMWKTIDTSFEIPKGINNCVYNDHLNYLNSLNTIIERRIALWCIHNHKNLSHKNASKWILVFYEELVLNPKKGFRILLRELGFSVDEKHYNSINFSKPSSSDFLKNHNEDPQKQLKKYICDWDDERLDKIQSIFDTFNIKIYSAKSPYPLKN